MRGDQRVTVIFFGEGATKEGVFHESMNFAQNWQAAELDDGHVLL